MWAKKPLSDTNGEVPVTNIYRMNIKRTQLPVKMTAYTPCSAGKRAVMEKMYADSIACINR